jgi:excisionase family DNA binding protein
MITINVRGTKVEVLTVAEVADYLDVAKATVYKLVNKNEIDFYRGRVSNKLLFTEESILAFEEYDFFEANQRNEVA